MSSRGKNGYNSLSAGTPQADVLVALQNTATPIVDTLEASIAVVNVKRPAPVRTKPLLYLIM